MSGDVQFEGTPEEWDALVQRNKQNMAQQTAVEWLYNELEKHEEGVSEYFSRKAIYKQAKAMEKEQITDAYIMGSYDMADKKFNPSQYYNETYNK